MRQGRGTGRIGLLLGLCAVSLGAAGCSIAGYRQDADKVAAGIIADAQMDALGRTGPFTIERPAETLRRRLLARQMLPVSSEASLGTDRLKPIDHWPEDDYPMKPAKPGEKVPARSAAKPHALSMSAALQAAARNSRTYQTRKEDIFRAALALDLRRDEFRLTYTGLLETLFDVDFSSGKSVRNLSRSGEAGLTKRLKSGATLAGRIVFDLASLLSGDRGESRGIFFDATITIPLLSGSGRHIVAEPMTQAERNVVYSVRRFERFKRTFAVQVASAYLAVLQQQDQVKNAFENYRNLIASAERALALDKAGRLSKVQVDQARQNELRARDRWITSRTSLGRRTDQFKITLGLPTDARIVLDAGELARLGETAKKTMGLPDKVPARKKRVRMPRKARPFGLTEAAAIKIALRKRHDLTIRNGEVFDRQRAAVVAADALGFGLTFTGTAAAGGRRGLGAARLENAQLQFNRGSYGAGLLLDLPWEKTAERDAYRGSLIDLEAAVRGVQELEDQIKLQIRDALRKLQRTREGYGIQVQAVKLAERRVESTNLFLLAGRAQIRDLLEAQESLIGAQNALTSALVDYRVAMLELQRDMGVLEVNEKGIWREYRSKTEEK